MTHNSIQVARAGLGTDTVGGTDSTLCTKLPGKRILVVAGVAVAFLQSFEGISRGSDWTG